jgi:NAD+ synthase
LKKISSINKFIKNYFTQAGRQKAVIGVSGGLDSSVTCFLCCQALGSQNVFPIFIPYQPFSAKKSFANVKRIIKLAKIPEKNFIVEDITSQLNVFKKKHPEISKIDFGNKIARERMSVLYYYARKLKGLVVGTSNKSELLLGYFTLHGDGATDLTPLAHLYKTEVKKLAKLLGVPQVIINSVPSAGLWFGQTDEGELGFSYEIADKILKKFVDKKLSAKQIEKTGIPIQSISRVLQRYQINKFKLSPIGSIRYNET